MKVYVLTAGCHEDRGVLGVYAVPEDAMAAFTPADGMDVVKKFYGDAVPDPDLYVWERCGDGSWSMAYTCAEIHEQEVRNRP